MSDDRKQKNLPLSKEAHQVLDAHPGAQSELVEDLIEQFALTGSIDEAAERVRLMRLEDLKYTLYESYDNVFSQFESHNIVATNPAVRRHADKAAMPVDDFVEVQKHLSWTAGRVTIDDVEALIDPESDDAVVNPTTVAEAAGDLHESA
jgi:hypothetical protein